MNECSTKSVRLAVRRYEGTGQTNWQTRSCRGSVVLIH